MYEEVEETDRKVALTSLYLEESLNLKQKLIEQIIKEVEKKYPLKEAKGQELQKIVQRTFEEDYELVKTSNKQYNS